MSILSLVKELVEFDRFTPLHPQNDVRPPFGEKFSPPSQRFTRTPEKGVWLDIARRPTRAPVDLEEPFCQYPLRSPGAVDGGFQSGHALAGVIVAASGCPAMTSAFL
jgi:hypothetical protein